MRELHYVIYMIINDNFISKLTTRENSVSLPVVSSGVASSEELSYKYLRNLQLLLHLQE